ncbi:MAG: enoyl-CoA hydratase/isomerase family protein, partial [Pseudomonadota bacterium]
KEDVARCAPGANAAIKALLLATPAMDAIDFRTRAAERFADCLLSDEGREGIAAFAAKRKPGWAEQGDR